jgi:sec-independent protein translocase protein TatB
VFDVSPLEMLVIAVLALLLLGPDKLPQYAAEAARFIRQLRNMANEARTEVTRELGPELEGLNLRELDPRSLVRRHLLDPLDDDEDSPPSRDRPARHRSEAPSGSDAPYDPDTT